MQCSQILMSKFIEYSFSFCHYVFRHGKERIAFSKLYSTNLPCPPIYILEKNAVNYLPCSEIYGSIGNGSNHFIKTQCCGSLLEYFKSLGITNIRYIFKNSRGRILIGVSAGVPIRICHYAVPRASSKQSSRYSCLVTLPAASNWKRRSSTALGVIPSNLLIADKWRNIETRLLCSALLKEAGRVSNSWILSSNVMGFIISKI